MIDYKKEFEDLVRVCRNRLPSDGPVSGYIEHVLKRIHPPQTVTPDPFISDHISYKEATHSATANRLGIDNTPKDFQITSMQMLAAHVFEPLRHHHGKPIAITSFFRSRALNTAIHGSDRSQHMCHTDTHGLFQAAMDIDCDVFNNGITNKQAFEFIRDNLEFDQLIWEFGDDDNPAWVHVSLKSRNNRREVKRSVKDARGKTIYRDLI